MFAVAGLSADATEDPMAAYLAAAASDDEPLMGEDLDDVHDSLDDPAGGRVIGLDSSCPISVDREGCGGSGGLRGRARPTASGSASPPSGPRRFASNGRASSLRWPTINSVAMGCRLDYQATAAS